MLNPLKWFRSSFKTSSSNLSEIFDFNQTSSGENITTSNAMQISTVFACVRVLSESVGSLPLHLYSKNKDKKEKAYNHPLYNILNLEPNKEISSINFWEMCISHLCLNGNFYAQILKSKGNKILELIPLLPNNVNKYRLSNDEIIYTYYNGKKTYEFKKDEIFEVIGFSRDGFHGMSPIAYQKEALGLAKTAEKHAGKFLKNDSTPPSAITLKNSLTEEQYKRLKKSWQEANSGKNKYKIAILENDAQLKTMALSNADSQFLENRQFQKSEICGIYRVPPHLVADLTKSSFSNIAEQSQELVKYTLTPYLRKIEQAISNQLLSLNERKKYYAKFNVDGFLRGNITARYRAYKMGRDMGVLSANEIRAMEELNPIEGGDKYLVPLNMTDQKLNQGGQNE